MFKTFIFLLFFFCHAFKYERKMYIINKTQEKTCVYNNWPWKCLNKYKSMSDIFIYKKKNEKKNWKTWWTVCVVEHNTLELQNNPYWALKYIFALKTCRELFKSFFFFFFFFFCFKAFSKVINCLWRETFFSSSSYFFFLKENYVLVRCIILCTCVYIYKIKRRYLF